MQETLIFDPLLILGAAIVLAYIGAAILRKAGIPQTLGFMLAGVVLGLLGIFTDAAVRSFHIFVALALGLIGYNIGHELQHDDLGGRFKSLTIIVIIEATAAFWLVSLLTYFFVGQFHWAFLFGAVASATAPAATADVVWECECEGPLTSSLMYVLAADDIVAVVLTNSAIAYALWAYNPAGMSLAFVFITPIIKILGSAVIGGLFGLALVKGVKSERDRGKLLELELGMVILLVGVITALGFSDIFAAMVFGFIAGKYMPEETDPVPHLLQRIMSPIVMIFFTMVGARMAHILTGSTTLLLIIVVAGIYLVGRNVAKYIGTRAGATVVGESDSVKQYLGTCLFCQAGVALGLSFIIEEQFVALGGEAAAIGTLILGVVAISTMVLEALGPLSVKWSLSNAGELPEDGDIFDPDEITTIECTIDEPLQDWDNSRFSQEEASP